jgi:hypothetical protein
MFTELDRRLLIDIHRILFRMNASVDSLSAEITNLQTTVANEVTVENSAIAVINGFSRAARGGCGCCTGCGCVARPVDRPVHAAEPDRYQQRGSRIGRDCQYTGGGHRQRQLSSALEWPPGPWSGGHK